MVEMEDFFAEVEIFEERRTPRADLQAVLIVANWNPLLGRELRHVCSGRLMSLTAFASNNPLIIQLNGFLVFCHMDSFFLNLRRGPDFRDELVAIRNAIAIKGLFRNTENKARGENEHQGLSEQE